MRGREVTSLLGNILLDDMHEQLAFCSLTSSLLLTTLESSQLSAMESQTTLTALAPDGMILPPFPPLPPFSRSTSVERPIFVIAMVFSHAGGNNTWMYDRDDDGNWIWPAAAQQQIAQLRQDGEMLVAHSYGLEDPATYELRTIMLDGYKGLDYQPLWGKRAPVPPEYSAEAFLNALPVAHAIFVRGMTGLGCNITGLADLLEGMCHGAHIFFLVQEGHGLPGWIQACNAPNLARTLRKSDGPRDYRRILDFLLEATDCRLQSSLASIYGYGDDDDLVRNSAWLSNVSDIRFEEPSKDRLMVTRCSFDDCTEAGLKKKDTLVQALEHYLTHHLDKKDPTRCLLCNVTIAQFIDYVPHVENHLLEKQQCLERPCPVPWEEFTKQALDQHREKYHAGVEQDRDIIARLSSIRKEIEARIAEMKPEH